MSSPDTTAVIYARHSPQPDENKSSENQVAACRAYAAMRGLTVLDVFMDPEVSGELPIEKRQDGARLVDALQKRSRMADHVIMTSLDRGWREPSNCAYTARAWALRGIRLHLVNQGGNSLDAGTPMGECMVTILGAIAQMERRNIGVRTSKKMRENQRNGKRQSSIPPYGWKIDENSPTRKRTDKETGEVIDTGIHTEQIPDWSGEMRIVREILELADAGVAINNIAGRLTERGVPCRGGVRWNSGTVNGVIRRGMPDPEKFPEPTKGGDDANTVPRR